VVGATEAKNGAVIRKHMGYEHIESRHSEAIEAFYERHFNPYLNFHRPCGVPEVVTNAIGDSCEGAVWAWLLVTVVAPWTRFAGGWRDFSRQPEIRTLPPSPGSLFD
jgi:hypothetical protein